MSMARANRSHAVTQPRGRGMVMKWSCREGRLQPPPSSAILSAKRRGGERASHARKLADWLADKQGGDKHPDMQRQKGPTAKGRSELDNVTPPELRYHGKTWLCLAPVAQAGCARYRPRKASVRCRHWACLLWNDKGQQGFSPHLRGTTFFSRVVEWVRGVWHGGPPVEKDETMAPVVRCAIFGHDGVDESGPERILS